MVVTTRGQIWTIITIIGHNKHVNFNEVQDTQVRPVAVLEDYSTTKIKFEKNHLICFQVFAAACLN